MFIQGWQQIVAVGLVSPVVSLLGSPGSKKLVDVALRLLHNLSFDEKARAEMVAADAIEKASLCPVRCRPRGIQERRVKYNYTWHSIANLC